MGRRIFASCSGPGLSGAPLNLLYAPVFTTQQRVLHPCKGAFHNAAPVPWARRPRSLPCSRAACCARPNSFEFAQCSGRFPFTLLALSKSEGSLEWKRVVCAPIRFLDSRREATKTPGAGDDFTGRAVCVPDAITGRAPIPFAVVLRLSLKDATTLTGSCALTFFQSAASRQSPDIRCTTTTRRE